MKVLLTGATGLVGKEIGKALVKKGHQVLALSRNAKKAMQELPFPAEILEGDLNSGPLDFPMLDSVEAVIHLAGENVGDGRWTQERKKRILASRADYSENLVQSLPKNLKVFVSASGTGYYGNRKDEILTETSLKGTGFLSDVCEKWENAVLNGKHKMGNCRYVILRTGVVLSPFGGALLKMLPPFQMGFGGVLGSGDQWISWIHIQDLVGLYLQAMENPEMDGIYNAVAPEPVTNANWTKEMTHALGVRQGPPVPKLAIKTMFGEMGNLVLESQRVKSEKLQNFHFHFATVRNAFENCCAYYRHGDQIFYAEQFFPLPKSKVFSFFSKAENLEAITPSVLNFKIQSMSTAKIEQGTQIDYKLKIRGIPMKWKTLIESWQPENFFVDTQLQGPYKKWHHTHSFEELAGGTLMIDIVRYKLPVGLLGQVFGGSLVRGDVEEIFKFRRSTVGKLLEKA